jgi:carboxyl-terminal processing protease
MTDAEFNDFTKYLQNKDYSYKTETEIALDSLKQIASRENYYEAIKTEYIALEGKLSHDKQKDLMKNKAEIKQLLESEITSRYYFQKGRIAQGLQYDKDVIKANSILSNHSNYSGLLQAKK